MTYVVTDSCIKCKYTDCVEVCPVDCFYEGELMLVINPEECIDCGVCVPECPIDAIKDAEQENLNLYESEEILKWREINAKYSKTWQNITVQKSPPKDADEYKYEKHKFEKYFNNK